MRRLRYSINVTLDGCCDHREGIADEAAFAQGYGVPEKLHRHAVENLDQVNAFLLGRVTYE